MSEPTSDLTAGRATCQRCGIRIAFLRGIGWVHAEPGPEGDAIHEAVPAMSWRLGELGFEARCTGFVVSGGHVMHSGPCPLCGESGR